MTDYERIEKVIRFLQAHGRQQPSIPRLAEVAGLSESHFHRLFSRWAGTTPKDFVRFLTAQHARALLRQSRDLLSTALESGLSGPGRLHDLIVAVEAVTPGEYKSGGEGVEIRYGIHPTPFGAALIGVTERGICHLAFASAQDPQASLAPALEEQWPRARLRKDAQETRKEIDGIFGVSASQRLKVLLRGSPFQIKVWEALLRLPPGHVLSYGDVASALKMPAASRAIGNAVGANTIGFLIPCHRVIRESGGIGGYRWGEERKRAILAWEQSRKA